MYKYPCKEPTQIQMVKTRAHELGHYFDVGREGSPSEGRETVAESVAFVVAAYYGIDTTTYTFPNVVGWAKERDGSEIIKTVIRRVQQTAHKMLDLLEGEKDPGTMTPLQRLKVLSRVAVKEGLPPI